ncbi:MAG: 50S ribosomal protein L25 [Patescibacteria group bacterium]|nr:50S ribosomal protein L25 [Patescibacteria group bacterium]
MGIGKYSITAKPRDIAESLSALRRAGQLPAVVYGKETDSKPVVFDIKEFYNIYRQAGESSLVNLNLDNEDRIVLFKDLQHDPRTNEVTHVDLYQIKLGEKLRTDIPLVFVGESPAVEELEGVLITNKDKVEIECLPRDLPHAIEVDLSALKAIDDSIQIKDLKLPGGVEILDDAEESIVVVNAKREEEEEPVVSEAEAVAGVEVESEAGAEAAEGEAKTTETPADDK